MEKVYLTVKVLKRLTSACFCFPSLLIFCSFPPVLEAQMFLFPKVNSFAFLIRSPLILPTRSCLFLNIQSILYIFLVHYHNLLIIIATCKAKTLFYKLHKRIDCLRFSPVHLYSSCISIWIDSVELYHKEP